MLEYTSISQELHNRISLNIYHFSNLLILSSASLFLSESTICCKTFLFTSYRHAEIQIIFLLKKLLGFLNIWRLASEFSEDNFWSADAHKNHWIFITTTTTKGKKKDIKCKLEKLLLKDLHLFEKWLWMQLSKKPQGTRWSDSIKLHKNVIISSPWSAK